MQQFSQQTVSSSPWYGNGLCDCFSDCTSCCRTCWFPCITYADNGQLLHGGDSSRYWVDFLLYLAVCFFTGCECVLGMARRSELRGKYNLLESPCNDCCVHCCCHLCALCQEHRELRIRVSAGMATVFPPPLNAQMGVPAPVAYTIPVSPPPLKAVAL